MSSFSLNRFFCIFLLLSITNISFAQIKSKQFKINANIKDLNVKKAYIWYWDDNLEHSDSTEIVDGKFSFSGKIEFPSPAEIGFIENRQITPLHFYIDSGTMTIDGDVEKFYDLPVTGSATQSEFVILKNSNKKYEKLKDSLYFLSSPTKAELNNKIKSVDSVQFLEDMNSLIFVREHPNSMVSLNKLDNLKKTVPIDSLLSAFNSMSPVLKSTSIGYILNKELVGLKKTAIGNTAPDFTARDTSGQTHSLKSYRGKYVLVDFWASWCMPCRAENPNVLNAYNTYKNKGFDVVGFSLDGANAVKSWKDAIKKDRLTYSQLSDLQAGNSEIVSNYGVSSIPSNFLLDKDGKIIAKDLRGEDLINKLKELFD